jgi:hypothetical protein
MSIGGPGAATPPFGDGRRGEDGRFAKGNPGGPGNPLGGKVARLRSVLVDAVTPEDMAHIARVLVDQAKRGDPKAIRELLNRILGRPVEADLIQRLDTLEAALRERGRGAGRGEDDP